jgi:predicted RNase H-like HicB family nuclease
MAQPHIFFNISLPYKLTKRKKWILASCPILDIHSQGPTEKSAAHNLQEAISLFLISCVERGTLDAVLKECGFELVTSKETHIRRPSKSATNQKYIDIPIPFKINPSHAYRSCHA